MHAMYARRMFENANNIMQSNVNKLVSKGHSYEQSIAYVKKTQGGDIAKQLERELHSLGCDPSVTVKVS